MNTRVKNIFEQILRKYVSQGIHLIDKDFSKTLSKQTIEQQNISNNRTTSKNQKTRQIQFN